MGPLRLVFTFQVQKGQNQAVREPQCSSSSSPSTSPASSTTISGISSSNSNNNFNYKRPRQTNMPSYLPKKITASNKKNIDAHLLKLFYCDYQPFRVVEDVGFKQFVRALNPNYELPSRQTISNSYIPSLYEECVLRVKEIISQVSSVSLTTDSWTSKTNDSFVGITVHFIDDEFRFRSVLLKCATFDQAHTGVNLAKDLKDVAEEWGLLKKIVLTVTDNAANIKAAVINELGWKHFGCYAHTLNLIVQSALNLDIIKELIDKVKTIVGHFKKSTKATSLLIKTQQKAGVKNPLKLLQDVATRWNSTFYMLQRFTELEEAVRTTVALLDVALPHINVEEWQILRDLQKILEPFEEATRAVSGQEYMTASLVIVITNSLLDICKEVVASPEFVVNVKLVAKKLEKELNERVGKVEYSSTLAMCTFLDPRFKTTFFKNNDAIEKTKKNVISALADIINRKDLEHDTFGTGTNESNNDRDTSTTTVAAANLEKQKLSLWISIDKFSINNYTQTKSSTSRAIIEVQRYMDDNLVIRKKDPLTWWLENKFIYPHLSMLVKEKCCVVATSVPCEHLFSKAGQILSERRTRLGNTKAQQLLFLNVNTKLL